MSIVPLDNDESSAIPLTTWALLAALFSTGIALLAVSRIIPLIECNKLLSLLFDLFGSFLVIAIPCEILRSVFFEKGNTSFFINRVNEALDKKIDTVLLRSREFGLDGFEESFHPETLFKNLSRGDTLWWLDTFCPGHKKWIGSVESAIKRGAHIKILALDPDATACELRSIELCDVHYSPDRFVGELKSFIGDFREIVNKLTPAGNTIEGSLEVVLYNDLLGVPCYVVCKNEQPAYAYSSMYLTMPTGIDFPHFKWRQGPICQALFDYVKAKHDRFSPSG